MSDYNDAPARITLAIKDTLDLETHLAFVEEYYLLSTGGLAPSFRQPKLTLLNRAVTEIAKGLEKERKLRDKKRKAVEKQQNAGKDLNGQRIALENSKALEKKRIAVDKARLDGITAQQLILRSFTPSSHLNVLLALIPDLGNPFFCGRGISYRRPR